ncbi:hypothetical protein [Listeria newyorkensis]|uniref:hypothetical protein n=1 Tax=Listeria newyorkensis TaxID=1497681 RepID=UPI0015572E86|nr:hypothetical protein [Listeria newyorkensis]
MPVQYIGFSGQEPYSIIVWMKGDKQVGKTVCYSQQEVKQALDQHAQHYDNHIFC